MEISDLQVKNRFALSTSLQSKLTYIRSGKDMIVVIAHDNHEKNLHSSVIRVDMEPSDAYLSGLLIEEVSKFKNSLIWEQFSNEESEKMDKIYVMFVNDGELEESEIHENPEVALYHKFNSIKHPPFKSVREALNFAKEEAPESSIAAILINDRGFIFNVFPFKEGPNDE